MAVPLHITNIQVGQVLGGAEVEVRRM